MGSNAVQGGSGFRVDPGTVFQASVQFLDTRDFVFNIASGVVGDLASTAGMAGDDSTAHSFASKYEPAAKAIVDAIDKSGMGMAAISSRLLTMATNYLATEDSIAAALTGKIDTQSGLQPTGDQCDPTNASASLPMVTGSKQVHEIPVIGKFWPQGDPDKLRHAAQVWAKCASLIDTAQSNAAGHASVIKAECDGQAFEAFHAYAATIYADRPQGGTTTSAGLPLMENLSAACRVMHDTCQKYADAIDTCRDTLIGLATTAGLVTAGGILLTVFTFGGSDAAAAAADAGIAAEAAAAADALATAEADAAAAAAVAEAEQIVAQLAAKLAVTAGVTTAALATSAVGADAATPPGMNLAAASAPPPTPVTAKGNAILPPIGPPDPPPYPLFTPAQQAAAAAWAAGLPDRGPHYGTPADRAYQVQVAGSPERQVPGANGETVWADGYRPADGALIDAKNVRKMGCSPRTLEGLREEKFMSKKLSMDDSDEFSRYQAAINNPANHAQYLEVDTPDPSTVGYWQFILAANHVTKSNVRVVP
ncbi:restriction endonuclease fold toxin-2 domain-containing protein [Kitasatospora sp. NPDC006697]|uniref:restriction endonuclease fold toxin-2 domain-containing protein n=1 Tax=Kitasatospora sp. NPDC006697 TaxID=3364020 RepID=UPI003686A91C